jgi:acyl-CoA thioesterase
MESKAKAQQRVAQLAAKDRFARAMGVTLVEGGPGFAKVAMTVGAQHLNFNGTCHGGAIFALADAAFGLASNSHGAVAAGIDAHITYQVAVQAGDVLTANAIEITRSRRLGVYRVDVTRADGTPVSSFTGTVYVTSQPHDAKHT